MIHKFSIHSKTPCMMAKKFRDVKIDPNWDGTFSLSADLPYRMVSLPAIEITFAIGGTWNGGSVPWLVSWLVPKFGEYDWPFFVHDLGYGSKTRSRKEWDVELLALCKIVDLELLSRMGRFRRLYMGSVYLSRRRAIYRAVRMFGGRFFAEPISYNV